MSIVSIRIFSLTVICHCKNYLQDKQFYDKTPATTAAPTNSI